MNGCIGLISTEASIFYRYAAVNNHNLFALQELSSTNYPTTDSTMSLVDLHKYENSDSFFIPPALNHTTSPIPYSHKNNTETFPSLIDNPHQYKNNTETIYPSTNDDTYLRLFSQLFVTLFPCMLSHIDKQLPNYCSTNKNYLSTSSQQENSTEQQKNNTEFNLPPCLPPWAAKPETSKPRTAQKKIGGKTQKNQFTNNNKPKSMREYLEEYLNNKFKAFTDFINFLSGLFLSSKKPKQTSKAELSSAILKQPPSSTKAMCCSTDPNKLYLPKPDNGAGTNKILLTVKKLKSQKK